MASQYDIALSEQCRSLLDEEEDGFAAMAARQPEARIVVYDQYASTHTSSKPYSASIVWLCMCSSSITSVTRRAAAMLRKRRGKQAEPPTKSSARHECVAGFTNAKQCGGTECVRTHNVV